MVISADATTNNDSTVQTKKAKRAIRKLFQHLKIERVISIDDDNFREPSYENFKELCSKLEPEICQTIPEMQSLSFEDQDILAIQLAKLWDKLEVEDRNRIYQQIYILHDKPESEDDMRILEDLMREHQFSKLSLAEWKSKQSNLLKEALTYRTLFLFDQNFKREGESATAGIASIKHILELAEYRDVVMCGLLSRTFAPGEEHNLWETFAKQEQLDQDRFILISKERLHDQPLGFARMIKLAALNPDCRVLKERASLLLDQAMENANSEVKKINIYDFEHIVFQSSNNEGIWEPDTLFRLFNLFHRAKAREEAKKDTELHDIVTRLRGVSNISTDYESSPEHSSWKIQRLEFYEDPKLINRMNMPVELGDIFEIISGNENKTLILIAQPCDLMVRSSGKRGKGISEAILAEIVSDTNQDGTKQNIHPDAHYELSYFTDERNKKQFVSFRKRYTVKLNILDLCAYQQEGSAQLCVNDPCSDMVIPTWKVHYEQVLVKFAKDAIEQYEKVERYCENLLAEGRDKILSLATQRILSLPTFQSSVTNEILFAGEINSANACICYNLKRIGRLCQPYSGEMLNKFASNLSRTAFDHDFGKELNHYIE